MRSPQKMVRSDKNARATNVFAVLALSDGAMWICPK
jgi:hypothetical protein